MEIVWLITHDNHIDRRIYFFAEVFRECGFDVRIFSSYSPWGSHKEEPSYVERPEVIEDIKHYIFSDGFRIDEMNISETRDLLRRVISLQKEHFLKYRRFLDDSVKVQKALKLKNLKNFILNVNQCFFTVALRDMNNRYLWYVYNNLTDKVRLVNMDTSEAFRELESFVYAYKKEVGLRGMWNPSSIDDLQSPFSSSTNMESSLIPTDDYDFIIRTRKKGDATFFEYHSCDDRISLRQMVKNLPLQKDEFLGREYDFVDFRGKFFDYSHISSNIKDKVKDDSLEKPRFIYVADLPTLPIGIMLKNGFKCPIVVDCHEWWKEQSILWEPQNVEKINIIDKYEKLLYPQCDLRITVGVMLAKEMSEYFECSFETIYSCIAREFIPKTDGQDKESFWFSNFKIPYGSKIAVFQGGITTLRNLENFARASKYLNKNIYLVFIGGGDHEPEIRSIVENEGNSEKVVFAGWIPQEKLLDYTQMADVGVLPYKSLSDYYSIGVPNKVMEYYCAKVPIICDVSMEEVSHIVNSNKIGLSIDFSNPRKVGTLLNSILNDSEGIERLRGNYQSAVDTFSYLHQKEILIDMLKNSKIL